MQSLWHNKSRLGLFIVVLRAMPHHCIFPPKDQGTPLRQRGSIQWSRRHRFRLQMMSPGRVGLISGIFWPLCEIKKSLLHFFPLKFLLFFPESGGRSSNSIKLSETNTRQPCPLTGELGRGVKAVSKLRQRATDFRTRHHGWTDWRRNLARTWLMAALSFRAVTKHAVPNAKWRMMLEVIAYPGVMKWFNH